MSSGSNGIVQKLWNYCNILRDDGLSYGDYVEQLTYLLFLKMARRADAAAVQPAGHRSRRATTGRACWSVDGDELEIHYRHILEKLGTGDGHARRHLPQGAEQDPGPGQAAAADRRPDRPRAVDRRSTPT